MKPKLKRPTLLAAAHGSAAARCVAKEVCDDLVWASWLQSVSPKAQHEIRAAVRKLAKHFKLRGYKWKQPNDQAQARRTGGVDCK